MREFDVYVPSRGRAGLKTGTLAQLELCGIKANVVVEPHEFAQYRLAHTGHDVHALPESNLGLPYSRNFILQMAIDRHRDAKHPGPAWAWMLDDDIKVFHVNADKKNHPQDARTALEGAFALVRGAVEDVGQLALEYSQYAWASTVSYKVNSYCDVAVCLHVSRMYELDIRYDENMQFKQDRDLTLQILSRGLMTIRSQKYSFAAPKNGSNKGGLFEQYGTAGREEQLVDAMLKKWGTAFCSKQVKRDGRIDVKINWSFFRPWARGKKRDDRLG